MSDEAFALLILENSYDLWDDIAQHDGEAGYKSQLKTLYTKNGAGTKKYQGWAPEGITRFRALVEEVKKDRATPNGKMFEKEQRNQKAAKKGSKKMGKKKKKSSIRNWKITMKNSVYQQMMTRQMRRTR